LERNVAADGVVDVAFPVDELGTGDVPQLVGRRRVVVDLEDPDLRVGEVIGQPVGADQNLRMGVLSHERELLLGFAVQMRRCAA
jgi:hypothetical protein